MPQTIRVAHSPDSDDAFMFHALANGKIDTAKIIDKLLAQYPRVIEAAAKSHEPHRIAYYLYDLAAAFHGLWTKGREHAGLRFIVDDNRPLTASRLALVRGVRIVIASGLNLMGVVPVEELR